VLRVTVYLKSGGVAEFHAQGILEDAADHPKCRLVFAAPEGGGRRLVYLDRDDVSAVVVESEDASAVGPADASAVTLIDLSPPDPETAAVLTVPGGLAAP
jgi:hypothetical protein